MKDIWTPPSKKKLLIMLVIEKVDYFINNNLKYVVYSYLTIAYPVCVMYHNFN